MLTFKREFVAPILQGRKWQTRRLHRPRVRVGEVYACRVGRFGEPFARVRVTALRVQRLSEVSEEEARAEGSGSREEFLAVFRRIYGLSPADDPEVWVVEFELVDPRP